MFRFWIALQYRIIRREHGAGMVEYALLIGLVGILLVAALFAFKNGIGTSINNSTSILTS